MQRRWGFLVGLVVAGIALVPLATAGAQAPPTTGGDADQTVEGSAPPGGTVTCQTAPTLTPPNGPPGTEVLAEADFIGNCDDVATFFLSDMTCFGEVAGGELEEPLQFPVDVFIGEIEASVSGTFIAPPMEPDPPVVDAIETLSVTITCFVPDNVTSPDEGTPSGTTYVYPAQTYADELFADSDTDQPTLVEDDADTVAPPGTPGVVSGSPTFTG